MQMKQKYSIFLVFITIICFLMSALELNTNHISNTFGDEYDTYISSDYTADHTIIKKVQDNDPLIFLSFSGFVLPSPIEIISRNIDLALHSRAQLEGSCKKFILNRSILI